MGETEAEADLDGQWVENGAEDGSFGAFSEQACASSKLGSRNAREQEEKPERRERRNARSKRVPRTEKATRRMSVCSQGKVRGDNEDKQVVDDACSGQSRLMR